jgi:hypothetical protein
MTMGDGKAKNALEYLDNLIEKGKATKGAIVPLKIAFTQVIQIVDGENWEDTTVKSIDLNDYMDRFANLTMGKYSSGSLTAYKSRVNKVINWYTQFLDKPGWTPDVQRRNRSPKNDIHANPKVISEQLSVVPIHAQVPSPQSMPEIAKAPGRILYPYPLTDGQLIHISLPVKLSKDDAKRIGIFIESIAIDSLTQGEK